MTKPLRVVSLFSGVGGFDMGLERAGMVTVAQVELDKKCQGVLRRHWPDVPKFSDVSDVHGSDLPPCDLVAFGSPCQDLSVAGKRLGMVDGETRSGLFYEAIRVIREIQEHGRSAARTSVRYVCWENVVGALSSNGGADFGAVLDSLAGLGAVDVQWRILDARWFGVPQRRRRVFVVARLDPRADGREQVLPLGACVRRNPASRGEARQAVAGSLRSGSALGGPKTTELDGHGAHVVVGPDGEQVPVPLGLPEVVGTLSPGAHPGGVNGQDAYTGQLVPTPDLAVRRLSPRECERLQGWPDDWTRWAADGSEVADSSRYRMCGNGVASPVAEWIGRCIVAAEQDMHRD